MIITIKFKGRFMSFKPIQTLDFLSFRRERSHLQKQLWCTGAQLFLATVCTDYSFFCLLFVLICLWFPPEYIWNNFSHFFLTWREWREVNQVTVGLCQPPRRYQTLTWEQLYKFPERKTRLSNTCSILREQPLLLQAWLVSTTTVVRAEQQRQLCAAVIICLTHTYAHLQTDTEAFRSASPLRAWSTLKGSAAHLTPMGLGRGGAKGFLQMSPLWVLMKQENVQRLFIPFLHTMTDWHTTLFMLFVDVSLCKRRRTPWCYVENCVHPWHRPALVPGTCEHGSVQL